MIDRLSRRTLGEAAAAAAALAVSRVGASTRAASTDKTLRFIAQADLRILDPIWTTAYLTRNHGYMVFDTLFAIDSDFTPHPQMVGDYTISPDKLTYRFKLRDGLAFHDGSPVRGVDCVASIRRWAARDALGQWLVPIIDTIAADGHTGFAIKLTEPFPLLIDGLAKVSTLPSFVMPERLADTDPFQAITEMVGSGPFKFSKEEFEPGHRVVYLKNTDYEPRSEPPSWASGSKVVKVDRVEWLNIPDAMTKAAALGNGEADWWENPPSGLLPALADNPEIALTPDNPMGIMTMMRFNQLQPPFNNLKMRQAMLLVVNQAEFMTALAGDPKHWNVCASFFTCGGPMTNEDGSQVLTGPRDFAAARRLIAEAGYNSEKITVLDSVELANSHIPALVTADLLKRLGLNVELVSADWSAISARRASKKPPDEGGWNVFGTAWVGIDTLDPSVNVMLQANGDAAWFGWPKDETIEGLRTQWIKAETFGERRQLAAAIQKRAFEVVPYIPTGQWTQMTAYRSNLKGVINAPALLMWNIEKV
ncbi:MAG: ABC transporter substrate-binding protein [Alphaproteobacteria bacterium]|nr:ABC transporter substrate-binding protein [Alphaproteobacteria bacterium]